MVPMATPLVALLDTPQVDPELVVSEPVVLDRAVSAPVVPELVVLEDVVPELAVSALAALVPEVLERVVSVLAVLERVVLELEVLALVVLEVLAAAVRLDSVVPPHANIWLPALAHAALVQATSTPRPVINIKI